MQFYLIKVILILDCYSNSQVVEKYIEIIGLLIEISEILRPPTLN